MEHRQGFDAYRTLLDHALDWDFLCDLADRIYHDRRLSWPEKDRLFGIVDARERAIGGVPVWAPRSSARRFLRPMPFRAGHRS